MILPDDVYNFTRLPREEETELYRKFKDQGDLSARDRILKAHIRYGMKVARRLLGPVPGDDELLSIVGTALTKALYDNFDPELSRFSTFALFYIRRDCFDLYDFRLPVKISSRAYTRMKRAGAEMTRVSLDPEGNPILAQSDIQQWPDTVLAALRAALMFDERQDCDLERIEAVLAGGLATLSEKERFVLEAKYWRDEVFETIGGEIGCSREWARRIHHTAVSKLRRYLKRELGLTEFATK